MITNKKYVAKMGLQHFAQTFNPDNVTMYEHKDGTIPEKYNKLILKEVMNGSKVMQLAKYEEMDSKEKKFEYFAKGPGAYWVGEGEKIQTSKPQWMQATMVAKKLAVIVPCSREFLHYKMSDFFEQMKPKIAEAFYQKFDNAAILNLDNPFSQSLPIFCLFLIGQTIKFYIFTGIFTPFMEVPSLCFSDAAKPLQGTCAAQGLLYFWGSFQLYGQS